MLAKIISTIMSVIMAVSGFLTTSLSNVVDAASEMIFGIPYTAEAIKADFFNEMDDSDVVALDETSGFVKDKLAVFVDSEMRFADKLNLLTNCGGIVSGWCMPTDLFVITYSDMTYEQAKEKCGLIDALNGVELAVPVMAYKNELNKTPDDNFDFTSDEPVSWNELLPSGSNWWLEAIDARQAWDYEEYFNTVNIGILDAGFEVNHPELRGKIRFPGSKDERRNIPHDHGTHVAGIISAKHNSTGIAGICENANLICVDWLPDVFQFWSTDLSIFFGISTLIKAGSKVFNLSLGTSGSKNSNSSGFWENVVEAGALSYMMASLISKGYDFLAVQSAGNGDAFGDPIDSRNNGHFCSLTEDNIFVGSKNVSKQEILDRIVIVASASNNLDGTFMQSYFSNVGPYVSIAAPGENIFSTFTDGAYGYMSGTSMAAPVVTAVAGLVWSVNPSFTAAEVKNIVCTSTNRIASVYSENEFYYDVEAMDYPMVNAKLAVEEAIRRSRSTVGTVEGKIIGDAEEIVFSGDSHTVYSDGTYSFVAEEGTGVAEIYGADGLLLGSFELTVTAGQLTEAEDFTVTTEDNVPETDEPVTDTENNEGEI